MMYKFHWFFVLILFGCRPEPEQEDVAKPPLEMLISELLERIQQDYVEDIPSEKLIKGALNGILSSLDPYSMYLPPKEYGLLTSITKGEYAGIGLETSYTSGVLRIITAIDDTPAYQAGLLPGDIITHIDGKEISKIAPNDPISMNGDAGTTINLTIERANQSPFHVALKRTKIIINPVKINITQSVAHVRLSVFNELASERLKDSLQKLKTHPDVKGIILDLRNNPGGTLDQAIEVASLFLESGTIVDIKGRNQAYNQTLRSKGNAMMPQMPMALLINKGSASASEIVAGALKDHKRAILVGSRTYGKGSVQSLFSLPGYGGIKLTTAYFYTPNGNAIHEKGVEPNTIVEESDNNKTNIPDPVIQKAIDLLKGNK